MESFSNATNLWILIAAALVFFMQAGFKVLETGLVKTEHRTGIGIKNLMDWVAGSLAFFLLGFGAMFGHSYSGFIGVDLFFGSGFEDPFNYIFFIFQLAFAGTALTIVSGAMSGRTALVPYFISSIFTALFIYPIFGHWAWGNLLIPDNKPWLAELGFMDFAGSTVVHSVGAWVGLVGIWIVGPRLGRFSAKGVIQPVKASDYSYSVLGLMILWLGWWGFNGGSTLSFDGSVAKIILNTNLAAAGACLTAYLHAMIFNKSENIIEKVIGGTLTGLVAITAGCNVVGPMNSIIIGLLAGVVHNLSFDLVSKKWKLDDPVGAIPVHGFGGAFGTLCVAIFGDSEMLVHSRWMQLGIQFLGIAVCFVFTTVISFSLLSLVKKIFGLRLSPKQEMEGAVFDEIEKTPNLEDMPEQIVSQVSVRIGDRAYNLFKVEEYLNLSREMRLDMIKNFRVQYLDDMGNIVPPLHAIRYLAGIVEDQRDEALSEKERKNMIEISEEVEIIGDMQETLIGEEHSIISVFPNSFVMLRHSKDVSSDFFWHAKENGYGILVAASCGDNNIPNAFLSALTISHLNEIVGIKRVLPPEKILASLDKKLIIALNQSNKKLNTKQGVEIGILVVNERKQRAYFSSSGSRISLLVKQSSELSQYGGLDIPLGKPSKSDKKFERQVIDYISGDSFYLFTSGFVNQLDSRGKKYSDNALMNQISEMGNKSMLTQKVMLEMEFDKWKGDSTQEEDVLILGVKP